MGNQLTGIAPSEILPLERYFHNLSGFEFESSLGSTRFLKVARAKHGEGYAVVKVFVIHDQTMSLSHHRAAVYSVSKSLVDEPNCLPFVRVILADKAGFLIRQYIKYSLYDRLSTRPFLNSIEKKWIAFQLLSTLYQCHSKTIDRGSEEQRKPICHGDIKSENVMLTSSNWLFLTDFASFKPTFLPENNPSDFNFFFDTSRRRTCYVAPERFVEGSFKTADPSTLDINEPSITQGELTPAMDIFSAGCVLVELFTEGTVPFDLSQLLAYRTGSYSPWKVIQKIEDKNIKELVTNMTQKDPALRLSSSEYLLQQRGKAFPDSFYTFLKVYLQKFNSASYLPDRKTATLKKDLPNILKELDIVREDPEQNSSLVIVTSLITANCRFLQFCQSKLDSLYLLAEISELVTSDVILERILPYVMSYVGDKFARVRAQCVRALTRSLSSVVFVPRSDVNVFPEYVLPAVVKLAHDESALVRVSLAQCVAQLAEIALRFLEMVQPDNERTEKSQDEENTRMSYDQEVRVLHDSIQRVVVNLLSDTENVVRRTLLHHSISRLSVFFGRQKASDIILSHMITFLNDKFDWHLRAEFFECVVGVVSYIGSSGAGVLRPLIEQGLNDSEEFVIRKTLSALEALIRLQLLQKLSVQELLTSVVPFTCHPNKWIRQATVSCVSAAAITLTTADVHCMIIPKIRPYVNRKDLVQVKRPDVLLDALLDSLPRPILTYIIKASTIEEIFSVLEERKRLRDLTRPNHETVYPEMKKHIAQIFRKLSSQGLSSAQEEKLLNLKSFLMKHHYAKLSVESAEARGDGTIDVSLIRSSRKAYALERPDNKAKPLQNRRATLKKKMTTDQLKGPVNEEWKSLFGSGEGGGSSRHPGSASSKVSLGAHPPGGRAAAHSGPHQSPLAAPLAAPLPATHPPPPAPLSPAQRRPGDKRQAIQVRSPCSGELRLLLKMKQTQHSEECEAQGFLDQALWDMNNVPPSWKPRGKLVAHMHEHSKAVTRILVNSELEYFMTSGKDGQIKLWSFFKPENSHSVTTKARHTFSTENRVPINSMVFCNMQETVGLTGDDNSVQLYQVESTGLRFTYKNMVDTATVGEITDIVNLNEGVNSVLVYGTANGYVVGHDFRTKTPAWKLRNDVTKGLITCLGANNQDHWMTVGTASGHIVLWDMRFQLPVTSIQHQTGRRIRRLSSHCSEPSWVVASVQGNNEVSTWDLETGQRQATVWASPSPLFSLKEASPHSVCGFYIGSSDHHTFLLAGSTDMRLRYWDYSYPDHSAIVAHAATDPPSASLPIYKSRLVDGTNVIVETYSKTKRAAGTKGGEEFLQRRQDSPHPGHQDTITDLALYQTSQAFVVTGAADGTVKVWK